MSTNIVGILLAAGSSVRFGANKLLHPVIDDTPVAVLSARNLIKAIPHCIAVVSERNRLSELLEQEGFSVVVNELADDGMGTSLACGVREVKNTDGLVVALADMPFINTATISKLAIALNDGASIAAPVYQGKRGHPVAFSQYFRNALTGLQGDRGARDLLALYGDEIVYVSVDDAGILQDIDKMTDIEHCQAS